MKRKAGGMGLIGLAFLGAVVRGDDDAALFEAGKTAIKSLKTLAPGGKHASYFAIKRGPDETIGYATATLEATRGDRDPVYHYTAETTVTFPNGAQLIAVVTARLRPDFEPIDVEIKQSTIRPGRESQVLVQRARIGPDKVTLSTEAGKQRATGEAPRPERPFIYGIETLVQRLDYRRHEHFTLREFNVRTGAAGALTFTTETWPDGTPTVVTRNPDGSGSYQFWFDRDGKLIRWGMPSIPAFIVRTTKERVEQLRAKLQKAAPGEVRGARPQEDG